MWIETLANVCAAEVGRGSSRLARHAPGALRRAARSVLDTPVLDVAILTGFYIPAAEPPGAETDGPIGAVQLAAAVHALGGRATLVTDRLCAPVVRAAMHAAGVPAGLAVEPLMKYTMKSHVIAVERVGPSWGDGPPRNMLGADIARFSPPLPFAGRWTTIGIGDGGNELGMGALPHEVVAEVVRHGELIHCSIGCDALIVGGTSNWAAAALVAALAGSSQRHRAALLPLLDPAWSRDILSALVRAGAVDGRRLVRAMSVDGLDWAEYADTLAKLLDVVRVVP